MIDNVTGGGDIFEAVAIRRKVPRKGKYLNLKSSKQSTNQMRMKLMMKMKRQKKMICNLVIMMTKSEKSRKTKKNVQ